MLRLSKPSVHKKASHHVYKTHSVSYLALDLHLCAQTWHYHSLTNCCDRKGSHLPVYIVHSTFPIFVLIIMGSFENSHHLIWSSHSENSFALMLHTITKFFFWVKSVYNCFIDRTFFSFFPHNLPLKHNPPTS